MSLGRGSGWIPISMLTVLYLCFEIEQNSNPTKAEKPIKLGLVWADTACMSFVVMPSQDDVTFDSKRIFLV